MKRGTLANLVVTPLQRRECLVYITNICEMCTFKCDLWKFKVDQNNDDRSMYRDYRRINQNSQNYFMYYTL